MNNTNISRRRFLRFMAGSGIASSSVVGTLGSLASMRALAAPGSDYRALVCVFLLGGNDSFNMVVPKSTTEYTEYANARQNLAIPQADLLAINPLISDGADYGFHPSMPEIQSMFNNGDLSIAANVGALVAPTTRNDYINKSVPLPPNLFSHNSQQNFWQSVQAFGPQNVGWSGRMAEFLQNTYPAGALPINISLTGANLLQVGEQTTAYNISASGAPNISGFGSNARRAAVEGMYANSTLSTRHLFESAFSRRMNRSFSLVDSLRTALDSTPAPTTVFGVDSLSQNLRMVAHVIAAQSQLNMQRQVFFVGLGGWDTHDNQLTRHVDLLGTLSQALSSFQTEMKAIACDDNVTTFTASDFGRTLTSNGDGSDHGWGSHQLVMGGAVSGQHIKGEMPSIAIDGPQDSGRGRIIPTMSVDQYGAAMARWFGVPENQLNTIFPNLSNFNTQDIGLFDIV